MNVWSRKALRTCRAVLQDENLPLSSHFCDISFVFLAAFRPVDPKQETFNPTIQVVQVHVNKRRSVNECPRPLRRDALSSFV